MVRTTAAQQRVNPPPPPPPPAPAPQRRAGRARGSQGYSVADCEALVNAVKAYLPLGRDEWTHVLDQYNRYATSNDRSSRDLEPLKIKFRALVNHTKPTGDPDCPTYVREAKYAQRDMDKRAHVIACADESNDEANGVGAHVSMSVDSDNPNVDEESFGTNTQPNDDQTRMASLIPGLDAYGDDDDDDEEEEEEEETEPSTPANTPGNRTASMQAPRSSATPTFSPWGQRSVSSSSGSHRNPLVHRVQTRGDTEPPRNPAPGARARASTQSPQGGLERNLMAYFDPQARDRREQTNGLNNFLQMCLQDARAENSRLTREITQLREAETIRVTQLRDNNSRLQEKISEQKFEIQSLQGKLELMQVRLDMMSRGNPMFHSQPAPLYHYPLNHQSQGPSNSSTASTSARPENCDDVDPET
ncbi:hypothetical protein Pst134EA_019442 [Puccinia striiformis f. sp. tritici]|uniref:hypothetical protein n=1 Tax=Puccinia striiformis f. sp. tritici TaxID=168172 RepID=UPI002007D7D3|nr:hypothetical protein Pst134EA_019442 [Puccinia striiformis f. sp. tritici]KAH9459287.1 hypothetical protein Pst134EA_019442 [Puccinia striiformis f. sp. tritici]KAI9618726.1 hypothetical protein KEM48_006552 [Puccinia striiformis f. sp. tritici PST-130]